MDSEISSWHRGKECHPSIMPSWNGGRCYIFPNPSSRRKVPNTHVCSLPVAMLPLECSAIKPQLIKWWLTRKAKVFHRMVEHVESWLYLKVSKHGIHNARYAIIYWKTVSIYLITPFVEKELCPSQYNFNWYLRHLIPIQLLGILVQKKNGRVEFSLVFMLNLNLLISYQYP